GMLHLNIAGNWQAQLFNDTFWQHQAAGGARINQSSNRRAANFDGFQVAAPNRRQVVIVGYVTIHRKTAHLLALLTTADHRTPPSFMLSAWIHADICSGSHSRES